MLHEPAAWNLISYLRYDFFQQQHFVKCKLMRTTEHCLATQTAQCRWNVNVNFLSHIFQFCSSNPFSANCLWRGGLSSFAYVVNPLSVKFELEGSSEVHTRIGGAVSNIGIDVIMLPIAAFG